VWGRHDCCLFAADAVQSFTGIDYAADLRGRYKSAGGAAKLIKEYGSMAAMIESLLGPPCAVAFAGRGDVVLFDGESGSTLGICMGQQSYFTAETGLTVRPTLDCIVAWRIR
jgi:hypothetical protein